MRTNDWHEMSIARAKPVLELSTSRPYRSSSGAKAIGCSAKSSPPRRCPAASKTASSRPACSTSQARKIAASSSSALGSTWGFAFSFS